MNDSSPNSLATSASPKPAVLWSGRLLSGLLVAALALSGVMKLIGNGPDTAKELARIGLTESMLLPLAIVELTCVAIYAFPPTTVLGAILLTGYMGGAICTHWRVGDPFVVQVVFGVLIWLGVALREPRLWKLLWR